MGQLHRNLVIVFQILTTLSAERVISAKSLGVMNWAFLPSKSASETPRALPQPPSDIDGDTVFHHLRQDFPERGPTDPVYLLGDVVF